jgi:hypothetical protein
MIGPILARPKVVVQEISLPKWRFGWKFQSVPLAAGPGAEAPIVPAVPEIGWLAVDVQTMVASQSHPANGLGDGKVI